MYTSWRISDRYALHFETAVSYLPSLSLLELRYSYNFAESVAPHFIDLYPVFLREDNQVMINQKTHYVGAEIEFLVESKVVNVRWTLAVLLAFFWLYTGWA